MAKRHAKAVNLDTNAEFSRLFWAARKEHRQMSLGNDHRAAWDFAKARGWTWAETILETSRLDFARLIDDSDIARLLACEQLTPSELQGVFSFVLGSALVRKGDYDEAIRAYRKGLDTPNYETRGFIWNNLGLAYASKGEYDEAIFAYRKALDTPNNITPGNAWSNLGLALIGKNEYDEAIDALRKALDTPNYDSPGATWNNLGLAHAGKGEYDEAIEAYHRALDAPNYDTPGSAWNNLGLAYAGKDEYDNAIEAYRKALDAPNYITPAKAWTNLAEVYAKAGRRDEAVKAFKTALDCPDRGGLQHSRARLSLRLVESQIEPAALSPDDQAVLAMSSSIEKTRQIEDGIIAAIRQAGDTQYDKYVDDRADSGRDNVLSILRGWSSAVTLLEGSERRWRGGGYFLKWKGHGIVIDPGFDFLRNFHDAGYHGREISVVIVSHNHPDHNYDMKSIDDLRYEVFTRMKGLGKPYLVVWDKDTEGATRFLFDRTKHRCEPVQLNTALTQPFDLAAHHPQKIPIRITPFKVEHAKDGDVPNAMGMRIELLDDDGQTALTIGYTADTGYFPELVEHLEQSDLLIAHISQPTIEELKDPHGEPRKVHLGYLGTAELLRNLKPSPRLVLIGEFWAGFTDVRIPLVKGLRERSGLTSILPAGLGMHLDLPSLKIQCTECREATPFDRANVAPPTDHFGNLAYLCTDCMIT